MSDFTRVIPVADLPPGQATRVEADGQAVALFNVEGTFYALSNRCPHRGGSLGQGFLDGSRVSCPEHNWTFDVTTGENVVSAEVCVPRHEAKLEDGHVWVKVA
jgi:NAD(P)H-dependent nitrite reductase small subunit